MVAEWVGQGRSYYLPLPDTATTPEDFELEPVAQLSMEEIRARIESDARSTKDVTTT